MSRLIVEMASGHLVQTWTEKTLCPLFFRSESKGKRDRDRNVVQSLRDRENLHKVLERKAEMAVRGEYLSKHFMKLRLRLRQEIEKREILTLLSERSIKNLNLSDFSYIKQVDGQIMLKEIKSVRMEKWN